MSKIIDYIEKESLSKFTESAKKILNSKKELALESERIAASNTFIKEDDDCDDSDSYSEEDPNFDVDIDPANFDENDMSDLESVIWDDEDLLNDFNEDVELEEDNDLDLTYEQLVYALENFEVLDELSKKTLVNYVKKSSADAQHQRERAAKARNASQELANAEYANRTQTNRNSSTKYNRHQHDSVFDHPEVKDAVRKASSAIEKDATRRQNNREYGQYRAIKKLTKEQIEYLDELSKKTLGSYLKKAADSKGNAAAQWGANQKDFDTKRRSLSNSQHETDRETNDHIDKAMDSLQKNHNRKQSNISRTVYKRDKGINKAVNKLTKEEIEHLDELSKNTLKSYAKKAVDDVENINKKMNDNDDRAATTKDSAEKVLTKHDNNKLSKKFYKRAEFARKAIDKFSKK